MTIMLRVLQLLLLISVAHAHYRGQDAHGGRIRGRYLQNNMNNNNMNGNDNDNENAPVVAKTDAPTSVPSVDPVSKPTSEAPIPTLAPTLEPVVAPTPAPTTPEPTKDDNNDPTTAPVPAPPTPVPVPIPVKMDLLDFVVSVDDSTSEDLTSTLAEHLTNELKKEFDSLLSVELSLQQKPSRRALLEDLAYSGTAIFEGVVSENDVHEAQKRALLDLETLQQAAPSVSSVSIQADEGNETPNTAPAAQLPADNDGTSVGLIVAVTIVAGLVLAAALYMSYRYYNTPPPPPPFEEHEVEQHRKSFQEPSLQREMSPPRPDDYSKTSSRHIDMDDYSLQGESEAESDAGKNHTQLYLAKRHKDRQQQQQAPSEPGSLSGSELDFSYDMVGNKGGLESDDDVYTSDFGQSIEVGMDGNAASVTGYFGFLGSKGRRTPEDDLLSPPRVKRPKKGAAFDEPPRRARSNDIPFDEPDERPFDETPNKTTIPPHANVVSRAGEEAKIIANQVKYEKDEAVEVDYAIGRNRSNQSRGKEDETEDLSAFLRGRRSAKRASRKSREDRKQPPVSMEI